MNDRIIERYSKLVEDISLKYNYGSNIKHLLYLIIPAFSIKYKYREKLINDTFSSIPIMINKEKTGNVNAYYTSIPRFDNGKITTNKYIVVNNYEKISLVTLLDSLVHEYNHAINSYNNEIKEKNNLIYVRTGLTFITYNKNTFNSVSKLPSYVLEEVINTKQTTMIIDIIKSYKGGIDFINNTIYAINGETANTYESKAYLLETKVLEGLINNKTFIYTLEDLRLNGQIDDIESWFNNITAIRNSYNELIKDLNKLMELELKYAKTKYFKGHITSKMKSVIRDINYVVTVFNDNCNYR